jgi:acrylyl-CoA reductase (NADPH)/3-hydroxypropionyl-CoA dehydratase/3-hydroxypropionyl-CoA synthetase
MTQAASPDSWGRLASQAAEDEQRQHAIDNPGEYHGDIAAAELHWFADGTWLNRQPVSGEWRGFDAGTGEPCPGPLRRFRRALLSLVRRRRRPTPASTRSTGTCWPAAASARGLHLRGRPLGPVEQRRARRPGVERDISYRACCSRRCSGPRCSPGLGLEQGRPGRVQPAEHSRAAVLHRGAKRLGIIYTPVFGGFSAKTLSDRIFDAGARVVVTADGGYRNAEVVPYKEAYTDQALDNFIPLPGRARPSTRCSANSNSGDGGARLHERGGHAGWPARSRSSAATSCASSGAALDATDLAPERAAEIRTTVARRLAEVGHIVEQVVVVRYTGQDIVEQSRDRWSTTPGRGRRARARRARRQASTSTTSRPARARRRRLWRRSTPATRPCRSTPTGRCSSSTPPAPPESRRAWCTPTAAGSRASRTRCAWSSTPTPDDRIYVIADPGWITGQSYLIAAPAGAGHHLDRRRGLAAVPARRALLVDHRAPRRHAVQGRLDLPQGGDDRPGQHRRHVGLRHERLKAATFCAEPVSPACSSSPWTGLRPLHQPTGRPSTAASCSPAPGAASSRWRRRQDLAAALDRCRGPRRRGQDDDGRATKWRRAELGREGRAGHQAALSLPRAHHLGRRRAPRHADWRGDLERFRRGLLRSLERRLAYTQGDYARQHDDGASRCTAAPTTSSTSPVTASAPRRSRARSCATRSCARTRRSAMPWWSAHRTTKRARRRSPS